jgi:Lon protease-like protein
LYIIPRPAYSYFTVVALALLMTAGAAWALARPESRAQSTAVGNSPAVVALPETVPLFPLEDVMLFPGMSVPLHIFEPRYRAMVADALKGNRMIGMVELRPGYEADYERSPSIFPIGCAGVITDVETLPNGEYNIVLRAVTKFRVTREEASRPYRIAHVTAIPEVLAEKDQAALRGQRQRLETLVAAARARIPLPQIPPGAPDAEVVNGLAQYAGIDPLDREHLLELDGVLSRATALVELLEKTIAAP